MARLVLTRGRIPIFPKPFSSHFGLTLMCLSSRADHPNPIAIFRIPSTKPKLSHIFIFFHQRWNFVKVSRNRSGASSSFGLIADYGVDKYDIGTGFGHFAIGTQDVYKMVEDIRAKGGIITREPGPFKGGKSVIAFVKDPDGCIF